MIRKWHRTYLAAYAVDNSRKIVQNVVAESWVFAYSCIATLLKRPKAEVPYRGRFFEILCQ